MAGWNRQAWERLYGVASPDSGALGQPTAKAKPSSLPKTTEQKEAIAYYEWAQRIPILADLLFHIGNERECSVMKGHLLKLQGIKAGVVDYFLPLPRNGYHGFWLELKRDRTCRVTYLQQLWLDAMKKQGYATAVGYGAQHAIELTLEYLK